MGKDDKIAYHGTSVAPDTLRELNGILPRVGWQKPALAKDITRLPDDVQERIFAYVGPVLRGDPVQKTGVGDADPDLSVSLTWSPRVACFFPPKHVKTYIYVVDVEGLPWRDVDHFATTVGVDRSYMSEIAVSKVAWSRIAGYYQLERFFPPPRIEAVAAHSMEVRVGPYVPLVTNSELGSRFRDETAAIPKGKFGISDKPTGIIGTFRTDDQIGLKPRSQYSKYPL